MSNICLCKFGGQTISDTAKIHKIALKVINSLSNNFNPVLVVSAMGKETDNLIELAAKLDGCGYHRELDQLLSTAEIKAASLMAMALNNNGAKAVSVSYTKIGINTDDNYSNAKIVEVDTSYLKNLINKKIIPVIAGFQGINKTNDVCTLGRGGSDITAIVLAKYLEAKECILFKDVGAIYEQDPKLETSAKKIKNLSYKQLKEIVNKGSKVVNREAVNFAETYNIRLSIASPDTFEIGTSIFN